MYRLDFTPDKNKISPTSPDDRFKVCIQAIIATQRPTPKDAWDDVIGLLKKLKGLSVEEKLPDSNLNYKLQPGGGVIELERGERAQLLQFIDAGLWNPIGLEAVRNTKAWVESTPETDSQERPLKISKR